MQCFDSFVGGSWNLAYNGPQWIFGFVGFYLSIYVAGLEFSDDRFQQFWFLVLICCFYQFIKLNLEFMGGIARQELEFACIT